MPAQVFRAVRIIRVARIVRKTRSVKELQKLVSMMGTCLKTLGWCFLFCFGFMTLWAMLLVEFVHPIVEQLYQKGVDFEGCQDRGSHAVIVTPMALAIWARSPTH